MSFPQVFLALLRAICDWFFMFTLNTVISDLHCPFPGQGHTVPDNGSCHNEKWAEFKHSQPSKVSENVTEASYKNMISSKSTLQSYKYTMKAQRTGELVLFPSSF